MAIRSTLNLDDPFGACLWEMAVACTFWGIMQFGEVSVSSHNAFMLTMDETRMQNAATFPYKP